MTYSNARHQLSEELGQWLDHCLLQWRDADDWNRIAENIRSETALTEADFTNFLTAFAQRLQNGYSGQDAYVATCRQFQFHGAGWIDKLPSLLGRAVRLNSFVDGLIEANGDAISRDVAVDIVNRSVRSNALNDREHRILRRARIGRHVIWATFREDDGSLSVIDVLPANGRDVATVLGLGPLSADISYVLIAYGVDPPGNQDFILHRPTIADAASNPYYRPHGNPNCPHGYTRPLDPNDKGFSPRPEIVHREFDCLRIKLPLIIVD